MLVGAGAEVAQMLVEVAQRGLQAGLEKGAQVLQTGVAVACQLGLVEQGRHVGTEGGVGKLAQPVGAGAGGVGKQQIGIQRQQALRMLGDGGGHRQVAQRLTRLQRRPAPAHHTLHLAGGMGLQMPLVKAGIRNVIVKQQVEQRRLPAVQLQQLAEVVVGAVARASHHADIQIGNRAAQRLAAQRGHKGLVGAVVREDHTRRLDRLMPQRGQQLQQVLGLVGRDQGGELHRAHASAARTTRATSATSSGPM